MRRPHPEEEFAAVKALLEAGADPTLGDSEAGAYTRPLLSST